VLPRWLSRWDALVSYFAFTSFLNEVDVVVRPVSESMSALVERAVDVVRASPPRTARLSPIPCLSFASLGALSGGSRGSPPSRRWSSRRRRAASRCARGAPSPIRRRPPMPTAARRRPAADLGGHAGRRRRGQTPAANRGGRDGGPAARIDLRYTLEGVEITATRSTLRRVILSYVPSTRATPSTSRTTASGSRDFASWARASSATFSSP